MFHARDGWHFGRNTDGSVTIERHVVNKDITGKFAGSYAVVESVTIEASVWASIVASVSQAGEDRETWLAALKFHGESEG